ncbi:MAG: glycosyltransferase family 39 protein [Prochlorothrix sp.]
MGNDANYGSTNHGSPNSGSANHSSPDSGRPDSRNTPHGHTNTPHGHTNHNSPDSGSANHRSPNSSSPNSSGPNSSGPDSGRPDPSSQLLDKAPDLSPASPGTDRNWGWQTWEQRPNRGWLWTGLWIGGLTTIAYLWHLGSIGLVDETEPLFAEAARQMLVRDDWVTPYFNEATRFDKPPLIYWCMAVAYQILGVNEWAARLPSALAAIVLIGLAAWILRRYGHFPRSTSTPQDNTQSPAPGNIPSTAPSNTSSRTSNTSRSTWLAVWIGTAVMACNGEMMAWGRTGVSDMLLTGCMDGALLCFFGGYGAKHGKDRWYAAFYTCIGLAILAKGPVGIVVPGLIIIPFLLYTGQFLAVLKESRLIPGLIWIALITVPWYVLVIQANGQAYIDSFFGYHNFERFTQVVNQHSAPWHFYFWVVLLGFAPWSLYLPLVLGRLRLGHWRRWQATPRQEHLGLFAGFWFLGIFLFFTIAVTKLPSYVLPLMPAAAILVALGWQEWLRPSDRAVTLAGRGGAQVSPAVRAIVALNSLFFLVLGGTALFAQGWIADAIEDPAMPTFPVELQNSALLVRLGLVFLGTGLGLGWLLARRRYAWVWGTNLAGFVLMTLVVLIPAIHLVDTHRQLPLRHLAQEIASQRQTNEPVLMLGIEKPSLVFYSHQPMFFARHDDTLIQHIQTEILASQRQPTATSRPRSTPETLLLLTHPDRLSGLGLGPEDYQTLGMAGAYGLVRIPTAFFQAPELDPSFSRLRR